MYKKINTCATFQKNTFQTNCCLLIKNSCQKKKSFQLKLTNVKLFDYLFKYENGV